ncbi:hypothetical protein [uncultured Duncaniella sp.]|jgi:DNA-binding CsgD family transcriptional regulator|uniref:hypothetical protein n=1 Tax=uncultured Duncaniella sp. TaxID=2768039 RepID=UPI0025AF8177|nr:hypothetical protein [uncultured Duncaniella sp.]
MNTKKLLHRYPLLLILVAFIVASLAMSCGRNTEIEYRLSKAEAIIEQHPDSAYMILKGVDYEALSTREQKARYALIHAKANMYMGYSLVTDTIIPVAVNFYKDNGDTTAYIKSVVAQAHHLRSIELKDEAFSLIDSVAASMPDNIQKNLNQQLLGFTFADKDYSRSLELIERQIRLADDNNKRFSFEIKKIKPLVALGRSSDAVALCDSLFDLPEAPETGTAEWLYLRVNYAAALGERRETSTKAVEILKDAIERMKGAPAEKLAEFYVPMINLQLNSGNLTEATEYSDMIDRMNVDIFRNDPVAATYLEFLKIVLNYEHSGALSLSRLSNTANSLRRVSNDLETKRQERDDALETSYDLSRRNYELTIERQRMWLFIVAFMFVALVLIGVIYLIAYKRRQRLIEAEERIEALEQLSKVAAVSSTDDKQALLKKTLLQQIGIIKTFAESPTTQNQEALRKISNVGNSESISDTLVNWQELYPVIDELYDCFHTKLLNDYPGVFSEREIQILCLLRADFSTKEIGVLIQQTSNSVYVSKTSIRKKLNLPPKDDFIAFLTGSNRP